MHYHHLVLRCLAITALSCVVHADRVLPPTISLKGIHDASDVQNLYNVLEGTFDLDPNIFGSGSRISHVSFSNSTDDILRPGFVRYGNVTLSPNVPESEGSTSLDKRAAIKYNTRTCANPPQFEDRLITYQQQIFLTTKFCNWVAGLAPYGVGIVSMYATGMMCGENFRYICSGVITIISTKVGGTIGPLIQERCDTAYDALINACGETGGQQQVTMSENGAKFIMEEFATTEDIAECGGATADEQCSTYDCSTGQCYPGGGVPGGG